MTAVAPPRATSPTRHAVHRMASVLLGMAAWFWGTVVTLVVLAHVVVWSVAGAADVSIVVFARQAATWFPLSLGVMLVSSYLRVHVASGMTRRTFVRATLLVQVAAGLAYGVALTALVLLERAVHDVLGWDATIHEVLVADESSSVAVLLADLVVPCVLGNLSGLLIGAVYQHGAWWGTLTLPLTAGPLAASLYVGAPRLADVPGLWTTTTDAQLVGLVAVTGTVLAVGSAAAFAVVVRHLPVGAKA